jgi:hypothetical protein
MVKLFLITASLTLFSSPAFAWGDVCKDTERQYYNQKSALQQAKAHNNQGDIEFRRKMAERAIYEGASAGCPWTK